MDVNEVVICGRIISEPTYSHSVNDELFNQFFVCVVRESGIEDNIPILANINVIEPALLSVGIFVQIVGQYRAHTSVDGHKTVFVIARGVAVSEPHYENVVFLQGSICTKPCYRALQTGKEITALCIANNQKHNKSYYLPVIVWDMYAKMASNFCVGDFVECKGRIQSRTYYKNDNVYCVYEMNVCTISKIKSNK